MKYTLSLFFTFIFHQIANAQFCIEATLLNPVDTVLTNKIYDFKFAIESLKDTLIISKLTSDYNGQVGSYRAERKIYPNYPDTITLSTNFLGKQGQFLCEAHLEFNNNRYCNFRLITYTNVKDNRQTQVIDGFEGRRYKNISELSEFKNLNYIKGYCLEKDFFGNDFYFRYYIDTISRKRILIYQQEAYDDNYKYLRDVLEIDNLDKNQSLEFGTIDIDEHLKNVLLIAIEKRDKGGYHANFYKSKKIFRAWIINPDKNVFQAVDVKGLYRYNEGYYKK